MVLSASVTLVICCVWGNMLFWRILGGADFWYVWVVKDRRNTHNKTSHKPASQHQLAWALPADLNTHHHTNLQKDYKYANASDHCMSNKQPVDCKKGCQSILIFRNQEIVDLKIKTCHHYSPWCHFLKEKYPRLNVLVTPYSESGWKSRQVPKRHKMQH